MINTNVGNMPLDIFSDYISDILDEEWNWLYLTVNTNYDGNRVGYGLGYGFGYGYRYNNLGNPINGSGDGFEYGHIDDTTIDENCRGDGNNICHIYCFGDCFGDGNNHIGDG
jgi:hypothetical protein